MLLPAILLLAATRPDGPAVDAAPQAEDEGSFIPPIAPVGATLLDGLGDYSRKITTDSSQAQRWFDQAMMLTWGFNHQAAERSFLKAVELDPECAMCWWGAALVLGPHVNAGMACPRPLMPDRPAERAQNVAPAARHPSIRSRLSTVHRTARAQAAAVDDVCIDHRGANVGVAEQFLNGTNIGAAFE